MKIVIQNITPSREFDKVFTKHSVIDLDTFNIKKAMLFAVKNEYGHTAKVDIVNIQKSPHHHCDFFVITDVEYVIRAEEDYPIQVNDETKTIKRTVDKKVKTTLRIEAKLDKIAERRLNWFEKFKMERRFNKLARSRFNI